MSSPPRESPPNMSAAPCPALASLPCLPTVLPTTPFECAETPADVLAGPVSPSRRPPAWWAGGCDAALPPRRSPAAVTPQRGGAHTLIALRQLSISCTYQGRKAWPCG